MFLYGFLAGFFAGAVIAILTLFIYAAARVSRKHDDNEEAQNKSARNENDQND